MILKLIELGTKVEDKASGIEGMLTHVQLCDQTVHYLFQPKGISPETGQPVKPDWITEDRVKGGKKIDMDIPMEILSTIVTDKASGYKGYVIALTRHINGCVHALVQAKGTVKATGNLIEPTDFDIRRLSGRKIPKLTQTQKKKSEKKHPSPAGCPPCRPRM